jgi:uncharacterized protein (DUF433 family)
MGKSESIIGAFSEAQTARLTGVSVAQLRAWDRTNFLRPSYSSGAVGGPFTRIYSFKDVVSLRVLNQLRNVHGVAMPELRRTAEILTDLGDSLWASTRLWVHRRKVVFEEPDSHKRREVTSQQFVADIPLAVATASARQAILDMNERGPDKVGKITRTRNVHGRDPVIAGTRIPVSAVRDYLAAGYSHAAIIEQFPSLKPEDIDAALAYPNVVHAA